MEIGGEDSRTFALILVGTLRLNLPSCLCEVACNARQARPVASAGAGSLPRQMSFIVCCHVRKARAACVASARYPQMSFAV
jgi:hypothetical protein